MAKFFVLIPVTGVVSVHVEAKDADAAIDIAWEKANFRVTGLTKDVQPGEFETHKHVVRGNVFYGVQSEIEVDVDDTP